MAPAYKKQKAQPKPKDPQNGASGYQQRSISNGSVIQNSLGTVDGTDVQPRTKAMVVSEEQLSGNGNGPRENSAPNTEVDGNYLTEVSQHVPQPGNNLPPHQEMPFCTICGGPLPMETFRLKSHSPTDPHIIECTAKTQGMSAWLYKKMYLTISLKNLREDPRFIPRKASELEFVQKSHQDFGKYQDSRKLTATSSTLLDLADRSSSNSVPSSDPADTPHLHSNPRSPDIMGKRRRKRKSEESQDGAAPRPDVPEERPDSEKVEHNDDLEGPYSAFPMHEACCTVANHYIVAANRNGDKMMNMKGPSSWVGLYHNLKARRSSHQEATFLADQYPHRYRSAAELQGQDWKRRHTSQVRNQTSLEYATYPFLHVLTYTINIQIFEASPTHTTHTTAYLLSKLRPLPHNVVQGTTKEGTSITILPAHPLESPWSSIAIHRSSISSLLLRNTTLDLPPDLLAFVRDGLCGLRNPPLGRSKETFLPEYWREVLLRGFPWLWDLDRERCRSKDSETYEDGSKIRWDWEKLARLLAQDDVFGSQGAWGDVPAGLRNRRRIWRGLDEMKSPIEEEAGEAVGEKGSEGLENDDVELLGI